MNENLANVLISVLSTGFLATIITSIYGWIKYRKQNTSLKNNEVTVSSTETQGKQIDLGTKYVNDMIKIVELVKEISLAGADNQREILKKIASLEEMLSEDTSELSYIKEYLDGPYSTWLKQKIKKEVKIRVDKIEREKNKEDKIKNN